MSEAVTIFLIMLVAGSAGGFANWISTPRLAENEREYRFSYKGHIFVGIVAAFTIPLFLSMAQSNLLAEAAQPNELIKKFIFAGFCIIASFSSRGFMTSISTKVIESLKNATENAEEAIGVARKATKDAGEAKEAAIEAGDSLEEIRENIPIPTASASLHVSEEDDTIAASASNLTELERSALRAAGQMTMRTRTGIAKDASISTSAIGEVIDALADKGLIERAKSKRTGGLRFKVTPNGIRTLNSLADPENMKE